MIITNPVTITKDLIQLESTDPGTYESKVSDYIKNYLNQLPVSVVTVSEEEILPGRKNLMAVIAGPSDNPDLVFLCHMDTVPVGNDWTIPPFDAIERDGQIYGRGACDMKSGLACALTAFAEAALSVAHGATLHSTLRLIATIDEEDEMRGVEGALASGWIPSNAYLLDTEPTNGDIRMGHKGRLWFHLTVHGKAAHASNPEKGADAIAGMAHIVAYIQEHISSFPKDDYFGSSSVCFGQISGGTVPYAVSDSCTVTIDMRLVPPATHLNATALLDQAIAHARTYISGISATYEITGNRPPVPYDGSSELLHRLTEAYQTVHQKDPNISVFTGYTDSAVAASALQNHNCISFGPGNLQLAHKPDESVPLQDILDCRKVLDQFIGFIPFTG